MRVDIVGPTGLTDSELAAAADLLARLVAGGAALGWVDPPSPAEVAALLRAIWSAPPGETALAVATEDASVAATGVAGVAVAGGAAGKLPIADTLPEVHGGMRHRLVGLAYWRRYDRPTHRPHADVDKVAVAPEAQGRGVGRLLMTELIVAARDAGIEVLTLDLRGDNQRAVALYESLGFERYGRLPRFVAVGDRRWDKLFYALDLRAD